MHQIFVLAQFDGVLISCHELHQYFRDQTFSGISSSSKENVSISFETGTLIFHGRIQGKLIAKGKMLKWFFWWISEKKIIIIINFFFQDWQKKKYNYKVGVGTSYAIINVK